MKIQDFFSAQKAKIKRFFTFEVVRDPDLTRAYIGQNYQKFETRRFNFSAFFFTVIYLLFRKLYVAGIVLFILNILLVNLVRNHIPHLTGALSLGLIVNLFLGLIIGFCVNRYYLFAAGLKIGRLKLKFPHRSHAEMRGICEARGGTNSIALTIGFLAKILSSIVMIINMLFSEAVLAVETPFTNIVKNIRTEVEQIKTNLQETVENGSDSLRKVLDSAFNSIDQDLKHAEESHEQQNLN